MFSRQIWSIGLSIAVVVWLSTAGDARAVVVGVSASNVDAYFGSQNDAYQNSNPTVAPWAPIGPGPWVGTALPPGVPGPPGGNVAPSNVTPFGGSPSVSSFNDFSGNTASSSIVGYSGSTVGVVDDAQIGLKMNLVQSAPASGPSYAYEQINYSADYALANVVNSAGVAVGAQDGLVSRTFWIAGSVGSFVEFGGIMNFWDVPTAGPATLLGTLTFSYNNASPGPFGTFVSSAGFIGTPGGSVNAPDSIRVEGDFYVGGDPSSISVESVPEPSSLALAALAIVGLIGAGRRQRR